MVILTLLPSTTFALFLRTIYSVFEVHITGYVDLKSYASNGVEVIKEALLDVEEDNIRIQCVGAPRYRMTVKSSDYLEAENILKKAAQKALDEVIESGGEGEFYRELE